MIGCKPSCLVHISAPFRPIATAMSSQTSQNLFSNFWVFASTLIVGQAPRIVYKNVCHPRMILSRIHSFKVWIPDYTLGNDSILLVLNGYDQIQNLARKYGMRTALTRSIKKAQTSGTMMNAVCEAP